MDTSCVKQSDNPSALHTYWGEPDQRHRDKSTNYYDTPKNVVDVLGGVVLNTSRRLPERRNHRQGRGLHMLQAVLSSSSLVKAVAYCK